MDGARAALSAAALRDLALRAVAADGDGADVEIGVEAELFEVWRDEASGRTAHNYWGHLLGGRRRRGRRRRALAARGRRVAAADEGGPHGERGRAAVRRKIFCATFACETKALAKRGADHLRQLARGSATLPRGAHGSRRAMVKPDFRESLTAVAAMQLLGGESRYMAPTLILGALGGADLGKQRPCASIDTRNPCEMRRDCCWRTKYTKIEKMLGTVWNKKQWCDDCPADVDFAEDPPPPPSPPPRSRPWPGRAALRSGRRRF